MKKFLAVLLACVMALTIALPTFAEDVDLEGEYDVTIWVAEEIADLTRQQIENFNNTREYKIKNTPTYNIMGQQVNRKDVKGLMIRDGKKYIAK